MLGDNPLIQINFIQINLGELSKPATVLIEKVADAFGGVAGGIGGIAKPWQIKRVAKAEGEAKITSANADREITKIQRETDLVKAQSDIEISDLQDRAVVRFLGEETRIQRNIESILTKAIPDVSDSADPTQIETDWLVYFFNKARDTSSEDMQDLWARILAGEANLAGSFSRRTLDVLAALDRRDAELFTKFCAYCWVIRDMELKIIDTVLWQNMVGDVNSSDKLFSVNNIFQLQDSGLVADTGDNNSSLRLSHEQLIFEYHGRRLKVGANENKSSEQSGVRVSFGYVFLTQAGKEIFSLFDAQKHQNHFDGVILSLFHGGREVSIVN